MEETPPSVAILVEMTSFYRRILFRIFAVVAVVIFVGPFLAIKHCRHFSRHIMFPFITRSKYPPTLPAAYLGGVGRDGYTRR